MNNAYNERIWPGYGLGGPGSGFGFAPGLGFGAPGVGFGYPHHHYYPYHHHHYYPFHHHHYYHHYPY
ncbi:spore coat protein [Bacillus sp. JJ1532]|uniref:Spore coat protein n=2 Tax=Cytobacillus dafuensis TaxID=1742359 RepID=A0A5B8ZF46_CYTDA|nr:spore coat protein [Cytobacillus dafuensis]